MGFLNKIPLPPVGQAAETFKSFLKMLEENPFFRSWTQKMSKDRKFSLGLDVGTHALRYVLLDPEKNKILKWGSVVLEASRSKPGEDKKEARALPYVLKDLAKVLPRLEIRQIALNLQDLAVVTGHFSIPVVAKGDSVRLIQMALRDQLSFPIEEAVYVYSEYKPEGSAETKAGKSREVAFNFAAAPRKVVEKLIDPVDEAFELIPDVSLQGHALESLIPPLALSAPGEVVSFLNIGRSTTIVSIFKDSKLAFERHIPLGGQDLTRAIFIMYLQGRSPRTAQDLEEAEKVKKESYIPMPPPSASSSKKKVDGEGAVLGDEENRKLFKVIDGLLAAWVQDIRLSFSFFGENYTSQPVSKVYLIGGGANLKNFDAYLTTELGIPAKRLTLPEDSSLSIALSEPQEGLKKDFHEYAVALALSLKPEGYAVFTPKEYKTLAVEQMALSILRTGAVIFIAVLVMWFFFLSAQNRHLNAIKMIFVKNHDLIQKAEGPYLEMVRWQEFLRTVELPVPKASAILKVLSQRIPPTVLLSRVVVQREQGALKLEGIVTGDAKNRAVTLSDFSKSLQDSGFFKKVEIASLESNNAQPDSGLFVLTASITARSEDLQ